MVVTHFLRNAEALVVVVVVLVAGVSVMVVFFSLPSLVSSFNYLWALSAFAAVMTAILLGHLLSKDLCLPLQLRHFSLRCLHEEPCQEQQRASTHL